MRCDSKDTFQTFTETTMSYRGSLHNTSHLKIDSSKSGGTFNAAYEIYFNLD